MNGYSMEVFAEARADGLHREADTRRLLRSGRPAVVAPSLRDKLRFAIARRLAWLAASL